MRLTLQTTLAALSLAAFPMLSACSDSGTDTGTEAGTIDDGTQSLGAALGSAAELDEFRTLMTEGDLGSLLDGPASYTLLAPNDAAFEKLGDAVTALTAEDQRPLLLALLRNHVLPGHLTPEAINEAISRQGGPVTMTTLGEGAVTFSSEGGTLSATLDDGTAVPFAGEAVATNNGVIIPLGSVLVPPASE